MRRIAFVLAALAGVRAPLAVGAAPLGTRPQAELPAGVPRDWVDPPARFRPLQIVHGIHPRGLRWEGTEQVPGGEDPAKKVASGVEAYRALGLGGIVCNVDFKDYMKSEDAFRTLEAGVEACARLGLEVWLYDEDGYPSGAAGGLVLAENPEFEARVLAYDPSLPEPSYVRRAYEHTHASANFYAARRAVDAIDDRAVRSFIAHTHEVYARRLGRHFGTTIRAFFTDEPSLMAVDTGQLPESVRKRVPVRDALDPTVKPLPTVPWTYDIVERYRERYGEDLLAARASLFGGSSPEDRRARRQFWELVGDLFATRYFGQIEAWCARHGVASSGHGLWEESILHHVGLWGNALRALARMGIPGLDELSSNPEVAIHGGWMTAALPASAAVLAGRRRVMTEVSDFIEKMGGKGPASLVDMQATAAWQAAWGVTEFTLYYAIPDRPAEEYRAYCDCVGRLNAILAEARLDPEALLYYPIRDLWEEYLPVAGPLALASQSERAQRVVRSFDRLGWTLVRSQVPFILADAEALAAARAGASGLVVAGRAFRAAIVPEGCELPEGAAAALAEFRASGGAVLVDAAASPLSGAKIREALQPRFRLDPPSEAIVLGAFDRGGRRALLLVNVGGAPYEGRLCAAASGEWVRLDPASGSAVAAAPREGALPLALAPRQALIFLEK